MSRRLDIELTSTREDGTWTWRAAGAKVPKGVLESTLLPTSSKIGDVLKIEADFDIDGITVLSVVQQREKSQKGTLLQLISDKPFVGVTEKLTKKSRDDKPRRGKQGPSTDRPARDDSNKIALPKRPERSDRRERTERSARPEQAARPERRSFTPPQPELPKRPVAKRLKPKRVHRSAVLESLPSEQRSVAERALAGGLRAVREAIKTQNVQLVKDGKPEIKADGLISMAQDILPKLRVAEWLDKAEAAKSDINLLDLRDLRAVVASGEDPMVLRDESTRALASELKAALKVRQEQEMTQWIDDIKAAIEGSRVVRALKLSGEPPKAGVLFPAELGSQIAKATTESLSGDAGADRWIAVLEALAFSPIRAAVKPAVAPVVVTDALRDTVKRLAPLLPQIALLFAIEVLPGAQAPRPLRPVRPVRPKRDFKRKPVIADPPVAVIDDAAFVVDAAAIAVEDAVATAVDEAVATAVDIVVSVAAPLDDPVDVAVDVAVDVPDSSVSKQV